MTREHRISEILEKHWQALRRERKWPEESEIDPESPELAPIWDYCFLVLVDRKSATAPFQYSYLGSSLVEAYGGHDSTAREVCERLVYPSSMPLVRQFQEVLRYGAPTEDWGEFINLSGEMVRYRSILLPLAVRGGREVGYILGGMKWKAF